MAFYSGDEQDYDFGDIFYGSDYDVYTEEEPTYYSDYADIPEQAYEPAYFPDYADVYTPSAIPTEQLPARFQPQDEFVDPGTTWVPPSFSEQTPQPQVNPVTGAITRAAGNLGKWAVENPRDVLGSAVGTGMGIYGLASKGGEVPKPNLSELARARAAIEAQASKTAQFNDPVYQAAMRNIQRQLDQPGGHDPRLVQQRQQERAQKEAYYQSRGLLGSDIANRELANFDAETTSLLERDAATRGGQLMQQYTGAATAASPEQTTRTFSQLANLGIQGAQMEQGAATSNAQLQEARRNQLLKAGGDIFGRSISTDPFEEERKRKAAQAEIGRAHV